MTKAIILTYAPVSSIDAWLLKNTKIFKVAINQHANEYNPHVRVCGDWNLAWLHKNFNQPLVSLRDSFRYESSRIIKTDIEFRGATIIGAVDWLVSKGYRDILIVGDNTVNSKVFQENVREKIKPIMGRSRIYQYTNGNFDLPIQGIETFIGNQMNNYIVTNCPCFRQDNICVENSLVKKQCQEYNCCVIKQVIDKCKHMEAKFDDEIKNGNYIAKFKWFKSGRSDAGKEILDMFDIEEINK